MHHRWFGRDRDETDVPIVLVHEGLGSISTWGSFPLALAEACNRPVLAYDRLGYGRSPSYPPPWPASFMHEEARALGQLLGDLGLTKVIFVGHSDGATIALLYAQMCPDAPTQPMAIVSLAAHVSVEQRCVDEIEIMRADHRAAGGQGPLVQRLDLHHDHPADVFEAWSEIWVSARFRDWSIDHELAAVTCPVLALQGLEDRYATRDQLERIGAGVSGPVELIDLPDCNHWPHREARQAVLAHVARFCDEVGSVPR